MEELEKLNVITKKLCSRPDSWKWATDRKRFGWGMSYTKNRKAKRGYEIGTKESRRDSRKLIKRIRHKVLFHIPLNEEELSSHAYREVMHEIIS